MTVNTNGYDDITHYQWTPGNSPNQLSPYLVTGPGTYTLTVFDAYDCPFTDQVNIPLVPPFVPQITGPIRICPEGDTAILTVQGNYFNFEWSSGDVGSPIIVTSPGIYEVTATDSYGCTGVGFFGVQSGGVDPFNITISSPTICPGQLDTLRVLGGYSSYQWSNGANGITNIVNTPGDYEVTVTNIYGCTGTASGTVTPIFPPNIGISQTPLCPGGTAILHALSDTFPKYSWSSSPLDTAVIQISAPGTYSVTVSGPGVCATSTNVVVNLAAVPTTIIQPPAILTCNPTQIPLDGTASSSGSNYPFTWSTQGGNIVSGDTTLMPIVDQPGVYILTITNDTTGCVVMDTVTVNQDIAPPGADPGPPATLNCTNPDLIIGPVPAPSDPNLQPVWTTANGNIISGDSSWSPNVDLFGTYILTVTNLSNSCTSTASVNITEDFANPMAVVAPPSMLTCNQSTSLLDGTASSAGANFSYQWSTLNGAISGPTNGNTATASSTGDYTLLVTNTVNGCTSSTTVTVDADNNIPVVSAAMPGTLTCSITNVIIDASNSSTGPDYEYTWTTVNGMIESGDNTLMPTVSAPGTYMLTLVNTANNCTATLDVIVNQNIQPPLSNAGPGQTLSCTLLSLDLDGSGSANGPQYLYNWSTADGMIISGGTTLMPTIGLAGTYVLQVTDTNNGCTSTSSTVVQNDATAPLAALAPPATLTCAATEINIDGSGSTQVGNLTFDWSGPGLVSGAGTLIVGVNLPGTYTLVVTNNDNGCTDEASVVVPQDIAPPGALAGADVLINCTTPTGTLGDLSNQSGAGFSIVWTTVGGNITSPTDAPTVMIDQAGTYNLVITNLQNGCSSTDDVIVTDDFVQPLANAGPTSELTCVMTSVDLQGTGSTGAGFEYLWTTVDGNIVSGETTLTPNVNSDGVYDLLVTNTQNGCTSTASVIITQSDDVPTAIAGPPQILTCTLTNTTLNASGSSSGAQFSYAWSTANGSITGGSGTLMPTIDAPGTYSITVTDITNNCTAASSVIITENVVQPVVDAGVNNTLTCAITTLPLQAEIVSSSSPGISYMWGTPDGQILTGGNTASPTIGAVGTYIVTITDAINGCTGTDQLVINEDVTLPTALIGNPQTLTCVLTEISLNTSGSSTGANFTYDWTTQGGSFVSVVDPLSPVVDDPGTYNVLITNTSNGCTQTASVVVPEDVVLPNAEAGMTVGLDCDTQSNMLDGVGSSTGANFTYVWSTTDGSITNGGTSLNPTIDEPGTYTLLVTNTQNGCEQTDNVLVTEDVTPPAFSIAAPGILTCVINSVPLNATGTDFGNSPTFSWVTSNGQIVSGGSTLNAVVDQPGDYTLTILNTINGCSTSVPVTVAQNIAPPNIQVQPAQLLTCSVTEFPLESSVSPQTTIMWTTTNGHIVSGQNSVSPVIDEPGLYQAVVTSTVNGCTATNQIPVQQETNLPTGVDFELTQPLCNGTPGVVNVTQVQGGVGPYAYSIDGGQTFFTFQEFGDLQPGSFDLVIQDVNGCEISEPFTLVPPLQPLVTIPPQFSINLGDDQSLNAIVPAPFPLSSIEQVIWEPMDGLVFAGNSIQQLLSPTAMPLKTTEYTVTIITPEGCASVARTTILVDREIDIYAPNIIYPEDPDGENNYFQLFASENSVRSIHKLQIFDRWGSLMFENRDFLPNDRSSGWEGDFRGKPVNPGVFVWWAEVEIIDGRVLLLKGDVTVYR